MCVCVCARVQLGEYMSVYWLHYRIRVREKTNYLIFESCALTPGAYCEESKKNLRPSIVRARRKRSGRLSTGRRVYNMQRCV